MANVRQNLSDHRIAKLRPPATGRLEAHDLIVPGLVLRITPRDIRSWSVAYKILGEGGYTESGRPLVGVQHRITLGRYPQLGLAPAREQARLLLQTVLQGTDPRAPRREAHKEHRSNTVAAVAKRFIDQDASKTIETWRRIERTLELHVLPVIGDLPIRDIGRKTIHALLDTVVETSGPGAAAGVLKHMHRLFEFALDRELIDKNPAHKLQRAELKPNGDAGRPLDNEELRLIWKAAGEIGYPAGNCLRLLMLTGQRRSDWGEASHVEIDNERQVLQIPTGRYKSRRDHIVPLVGEAWRIASGLPKQDAGDFLFSSTDGKVAINSWGKVKTRIDKLTGPLAPWRIHDLRVSCETRLASLGIVQETRDAVLGHASSGLQKIYNKHDYLAEKQDALALYEAHLMEVVG